MRKDTRTPEYFFWERSDQKRTEKGLQGRRGRVLWNSGRSRNLQAHAFGGRCRILTRAFQRESLGNFHFGLRHWSLRHDTAGSVRRADRLAGVRIHVHLVAWWLGRHRRAITCQGREQRTQRLRARGHDCQPNDKPKDEKPSHNIACQSVPLHILSRNAIRKAVRFITGYSLGRYSPVSTESTASFRKSSSLMLLPGAHLSLGPDIRAAQ